MKKHKLPKRMCVACRNGFDKKDLLRIVRTPENITEIDLIGKKSGRGAYLCRSMDCFNSLKKKNLLEKRLSCSVHDKLYETIEQELRNGE